jgi:hypothetical protein
MEKKQVKKDLINERPRLAKLDSKIHAGSVDFMLSTTMTLCPQKMLGIIESMRKLVVFGGIAILALSLLFPAQSYAQTSNQTAQLFSVLQELKKQVDALQQQLQNLILQQLPALPAMPALPAIPGVSPATPAVPAEPPSITGQIVLDELPGNLVVSCILPQLQQKSRDKSVYLLQMVMKKAEYYPEGIITGYYGRLTQAAVERLQKAEGISGEVGVGPQTVRAVNALIKKYYSAQCAPGIEPTPEPVPIPAPSGKIIVSSPASGEVWLLGKSYTIKWSASDPSLRAVSLVSISLAPPRPSCLDASPSCLIAEAAPYVIAENIPNAGFYSWLVPKDLPSRFIGAMQITVTLANTNQSGRSGVFTIALAEEPPPAGESCVPGKMEAVGSALEVIPASKGCLSNQPSITVVSPNNGGSFNSTNITLVQYIVEGFAYPNKGTIELFLLKDNAALGKIHQNNLSAGLGPGSSWGPGLYSWSPTGLYYDSLGQDRTADAGPGYKIRAVLKDSSGKVIASDESDTPFSITSTTSTPTSTAPVFNFLSP